LKGKFYSLTKKTVLQWC